MKKILLFIILFLNLQLTINEASLSFFFCSLVFSQHMTKEVGDNCYNDEIGWYHSPFSDCSEVENEDQINCRYHCGETFISIEAEEQHEPSCPRRPTNNIEENDEELIQNGIHGGSGNSGNNNIVVCPRCHKQTCICCKTCLMYPCICCKICHKKNCVCCKICHNYPCRCCKICKKPKDICICCKICHKLKCECIKIKFTKEVFLLQKDSVFNRYNNDSVFSKKACCNMGVQDLFKATFGNVPKELIGTADVIGRRMKEERPCAWHEIATDVVNSFVNDNFFVIFVCPAILESEINPGERPKRHGHMNTVLPGYNGTRLSDIHVMDTGYAPSTDGKKNTRSNDQPFTTWIGREYRAHGSFYYYDPSGCQE